MHKTWNITYIWTYIYTQFVTGSLSKNLNLNLISYNIHIHIYIYIWTCIYIHCTWQTLLHGLCAWWRGLKGQRRQRQKWYGHSLVPADPACLCMYACACLCMYVCVCNLYQNTHTHTHIHIWSNSCIQACITKRVAQICARSSYLRTNICIRIQITTSSLTSGWQRRWAYAFAPVRRRWLARALLRGAWLSVCVYTYIHTCMHALICICVCVCSYIHLWWTHAYGWLRTYVHKYMHAYMH
jgi:hypothetical protein